MADTPLRPLKLSDLVQIAQEAGEIMLKYFTAIGMKREIKNDRTPVTLADREINDMAVSRIRNLSAEVDIIAEEASDRRDSPWIVMIDPIDGTYDYVWGVPISTFMIGLAYKGTPVMSAVYDPYMRRMYTSERGKGAWMNSERLQVSLASPGEKLVVVGFTSMSPGTNYHILDVCKYLEAKGVTVANFASIGYMEMLVATGEWAATIFPWEHTHDTMQGHLIVEEAGGKVTDLFGNPLIYGPENKMRGHIMSNGHVHDLILEAVNACN